jgi:predicted small lipoprotein YifL
LGLLALVSLTAILSLAGCGSKEPPPVQIEEIDFQEAQQEATKEYGGM